MIHLPDLSSEYIFKAVRSSGKGGQHVNKVSTKIELYFNVLDSSLLTDNQKQIITHKLPHLINEGGVMRIVADEERSQLRNKMHAIKKLNDHLHRALTPVKKRIPTKTPKSVKEKRIREKKMTSETKAGRKKPDID